MRVLLTDSNEFLLSPDIVVCSSIKDVYTEVDRRNDESLLIYVDHTFVETSILNQLELYRYEFNTFGIILDKPFSILIELLNLERDCYMVTNSDDTASELFLKAERYNSKDIGDGLEDLKNGLNNPNIMKNMVEYDFVSFKSTLEAILNRTDVLLQQNMDLRSDLQYHLKEKEELNTEITKIRDRIELCERNRLELLSENLKMKYQNFLDDVGSRPTTTDTPLLYIKCIIPKEEHKVLKFFTLLNSHLRNKFNVNSSLLVIEDFNTLKFKKIRKDFTYISSDGKYNMSSLGNQIITTSYHVKELFNNYGKFSGIKDLFIVLDITNSTKSFVIGDGSYMVITNDQVSKNLYSNISETIKIEEGKITDTYRGEDLFNIELNMVKSEVFREVEKIAMELIN